MSVCKAGACPACGLLFIEKGAIKMVAINRVARERRLKLALLDSFSGEIVEWFKWEFTSSDMPAIQEIIKLHDRKVSAERGQHHLTLVAIPC